MANPIKFKIMIDGIDVSTYVYRANWKRVKKQPVKYGTITVTRNILDIFTVNNTLVSKEVTIQRGFTTATERYVFRGEVVSYTQKGSLYEISIADKMYKAVKLELDYTYDMNTDVSGGVGSEIVKDILTRAGLTYTAASIPTTGTSEALIINIYPAQGTMLDTLKDLANVYKREIFYDDDEDIAYFLNTGSTDSGVTLTVGSNIINVVQWLTTGENIANNITLVGGQQLDWAYETFNGTGSRTSFILSAKPIDTDIYVNSVKKQRGINSSDPKDFYVKEDNKEIIFTNAPIGGTNNVEVYYSYNVPVKVGSQDADSITDYTQHDLTIINEKVTNTDDAEMRISNFLEENADVLTSAPLLVISENTLEPGQLVRVIDGAKSINSQFDVQSVEYNIPYKADQISIGKLPITNLDLDLSIIDNIKKLKRQLSNNTDVNVQLFPLNKKVLAYSYTKIDFATSEPGVLYWDSDLTGLWDDYDWGTDAEETYTNQSLEWGSNLVFEDFRSTEFKDASTTATWSNNGVCYFPNLGQVATSKAVVKRTTPITSITLTADNPSDFGFQVSVEGIAFHDVVNGVAFTPPTPGTEIYWRAINIVKPTTLNSLKIIYR